MSYLIKPQNYKPLLDLKQTELGIKQIKEFFQLNSFFGAASAPCHSPTLRTQRNGYQ